MCRRGIGGFKTGDMLFERFKQIIDQLPFLQLVNLTRLGEPLLNEDIFKMIDYAKSCGIREVMFVTNGTMLNKKNCEKILKSGIDRVIISVDSPYKQKYESIRVGARFDDVDVGIRRLVEMRNKTGSKLKIEIYFTLMKNNAEDLNRMIAYSHELGIDKLSVCPENKTLSQKDLYSPIPKGILIKRESKTVVQIFGRRFNSCISPWYDPYVTWNGYLTPCCNLPVPEEYNFGNVFEKSFMEVWNGEKARIFRKMMTKGIPGMCKNCVFVRR
jgi:radical SAM protein with 4Fe4S-binding SPASM domain